MKSVPPCWRIKHTGPCWPAERTDLEDITEDELDASGARIFKINVSDTDSTGWGDCVRIYELELTLTKKQPSLSSLPERPRCWGVATASAAENEGPEQAFDQDYGTKWCTMKTPSWVVFDVQDPAYATG